MNANGIMGKIQIDRPLLNCLMLRVHKDGKQIAYQPIPHDLVELLTKKYNTYKNYHPEAIELFQKLICHSEIPLNSVRGSKYTQIISPMNNNISGNGCECEEIDDDSIKISSPEEAFNRLKILIGQVSAGNTNPSVKNEIAQLLEYLHKQNEITDDGYTNLMKGCGIIE